MSVVLALACVIAAETRPAVAQVAAFEGRAPAELVQRATWCEQGDHRACREVLRRYREREDLPADPAVARQLLDSLCQDLAYAPHSATFVEMQAIERRASPCFHELFVLERAACDGGDLMVCLDLVGLYQLGRGVARSERRARALLSSVCDTETAGVARALACDQLGEMYEAGGHGVRRDGARALALHERACADSAASCERLGALYEDGTLGPVDLPRARAAYERACRVARTPHACDQLARIDARAAP